MTFTGQNLRSTVGLFLQVDSGNVNAITIDNVGSTTFSGYTYFPNYLFHEGDTNTRIFFETGKITLRGDTAIVTEGGTIQVKGTATSIGTTQDDGDYLSKLYTLNADGFMSLYTGQGTPIEQVRISSYGPSYIVTGTLGGFGLGSTVTTGGFNVNWTFSGSYYNMSNTDSGNFKYTNQNGRLLTSNGAGWVADGRDPILTLSSAGNGGATTVGYSLGLNLYSDTRTDNTYSPLICFSNQSNSGNYATTYAAIGGKKTGQGVDANWSAGELHFWTAGPAGSGSAAYMQQASAMMIDDAGNVGIGTTTPEHALVVIGTIGFGLNYNGGVYANNTDTGVDENWGLEVQRTANVDDYNTRLKYYPSSGQSRAAGIYDSRNARFSLYSDTNNNPNIIIPNGNVGIGTTSPGAKLDIATTGSVAKPPSLRISNAAAAGYLWDIWRDNTTGYLNIGSTTNGTDAGAHVTIKDVNGNVGIGVTAPVTRLDIEPSTGNSSIKTGGLEMQSYSINNGWYAENLYYDGAWRLRSAGFATQMYMETGSISFKRVASGSAGASVSPETTMRLHSSGNIGINMTATPTRKLQIEGGSTYPLSVNSTQRYLQEFQRSGVSEWWIAVDNGSFILHENGVGDKITVASGGTLTAAGDLVAYSDKRLKTNIKTLDGSKVLKMRGVSFEKEGKKGSGVIAQELEKVAPELVNNDNEYKGVAYGNLTGYLIEAIKEQQKQIEDLQAQIKNISNTN